VTVTRQSNISVTNAAQSNVRIFLHPGLNDGWQGLSTSVIRSGSAQLATSTRVANTIGASSIVYPGVTCQVRSTPVFDTLLITDHNFGLRPFGGSTAITGADTEFYPGLMRCIGCAVEVINTSSDLYNGGEIVIADCPDVGEDSGLCVDYTTPVLVPVVAKVFDNVPISVDEVRQQKGSLCWEAKRGCYAVAKYTTTDIPMESHEQKYPLMASKQARQTVGTTSGIAKGTASLANPTSTELNISLRTAKFQPKVIFMTGLPVGASITVKARWCFEYCPIIGLEAQLASLSNPSPTYDPCFLTEVSRAMSLMPCATYSNNNASGDFFKSIMKNVRSGLKVARPILQTVAPMQMAAVEGIYGTLKEARRQFRDVQQNKPLTQQQRDNLLNAYQKDKQNVGKELIKVRREYKKLQEKGKKKKN